MTPRLIRALLGLCCLLGQAHGGQTFGLRLNNPGVIKIEAESLLNEIPTHGLYPVRITIENRSGAERSWDLSLSLNGNNEQRVRQSVLTVPDGRIQSFDYFLPISQSDSGWSSQSLQGQISGPGLAEGSASFYDNSSWSDPQKSTSVGILSGLFDRVGLNENKAGHGGSGPEQSRSRLDPARLPTTPLAFSGLEDVWLEATEWLALSPALRLALLDWVALGGNLQVINNLPKGSDQAWTETLPRHLRSLGGDVGSPLEHGFGRIIRRAPRPDLELRTLIETHFSPRRSLVPDRRLGQSEAQAWAESNSIVPVALGGVIIIVFLIVFTIVAGPLNLFVFARGAKRWRLFITTPIISLAASGLLVLLMFLQDGLGGDGVRSRVALLLPESGRLAFRQSSVAKTGLLTTSGFATEGSPFVWREDSGDRRNNQHRFQTDDRGNLGGDFFASRSRLFHQTFAYTPSDGKIVRQADENGRPVLLSTVDAVLGPVYLRDGQGKLWKTDQLALGGKAVLSAVESGTEFSTFLSDSQNSQPTGRLLDRFTDRKNVIIAKASNLKNTSGDLHPAIRWQATDTILVTTPAAP